MKILFKRYKLHAIGDKGLLERILHVLQIS
jgi:hypothetical protein